MSTLNLTKRELHLQLSEIENTSDAFQFSINLYAAKKDNIINDYELDMFMGDLYWVCLRKKIDTRKDFINLFN